MIISPKQVKCNLFTIILKLRKHAAFPGVFMLSALGWHYGVQMETIMCRSHESK